MTEIFNIIITWLAGITVICIILASIGFFR